MATITIAVHMTTYLVREMHLSSATSSKSGSNFGGAMFLFCLLGGIIADCFLGRYWTILIFTMITTVGTSILAFTTNIHQLKPPYCVPSSATPCQEANNLQIGLYYMGVYTYALGVGGVKACISAFGTDQFDRQNEQEKLQMENFFNRFFLITNIGAVLAVTIFLYVMQNVGTEWGYEACSTLFLVSLLVFLLGTNKFRYKERRGNPIVQILQVFVGAVRKRNIKFPSSPSSLYELTTQEARVLHTDKFRFLDKAAIITETDSKSSKEGIISKPWRLSTVTRVEEVKMLSGLMPIWATTIMCWTAYAQTLGFSVVQASTMDRSLGKRFEVPAGSYTAFMMGTMILTLTIYDRLIMPLYRRSRNPQGLTSLQKIGIGLFCTTMAMVVAALVEARRLTVSKTLKDIRSTNIPMSGFWLLPQFVLVGIGISLISSGQLDFFITESPKGMKAIGNGLFLTTISLGFFTSSILVEIVKKVTGRRGSKIWLAHNINDSKVDYFYGLLGVLSIINMIWFIVCARKYKLNVGEDETTGDSKDVDNEKVYHQEDSA